MKMHLLVVIAAMLSASAAMAQWSRPTAILFLANGVTATWPAGEFFPERSIEARDRIEHWITLEEGGEETSELSEMIALFLKHKIYFDPNLQMYGEGKLRVAPLARRK